MSEDSSYELDNYSVNESKADAWEDVHISGRPIVVVELPPTFLQRVSSKKHTSEGASEVSSFVSISRNNGQEEAESKSQASSLQTHQLEAGTASYVHQMGGLDIHSQSVAPSWALESSCAPTSSSETVISDFSYLTVNGGSAVRCKRCTFLNKFESKVQTCSACGFALAANPCVDMDEQVARHLQMKEEEAAFRAVVAKERKCRCLSNETPFERAEFLVQEIQKAVSVCSWDEGILPLTAIELKMHVSDMIKSFDGMESNRLISPAFFFARKKNGCRTSFDRIRLLGLPQEVQLNVSTQANDALTCALSGSAPKKLTLYPSRAQPQSTCSQLFPLEEDECVQESDYLGWIVAHVRHVVRNSDSKCYPLVAFVADRRDSDTVQRLLGRLQQACHDFFLTDWLASTQRIFEEQPNKKTKYTLGDSKHEVADNHVPLPASSSGQFLGCLSELTDTHTTLLNGDFLLSVFVGDDPLPLDDDAALLQADDVDYADIWDVPYYERDDPLPLDDDAALQQVDDVEYADIWDVPYPEREDPLPPDDATALLQADDVGYADIWVVPYPEPNAFAKACDECPNILPSLGTSHPEDKQRLRQRLIGDCKRAPKADEMKKAVEEADAWLQGGTSISLGDASAQETVAFRNAATGDKLFPTALQDVSSSSPFSAIMVGTNDAVFAEKLKHTHIGNTLFRNAVQQYRGQHGKAQLQEERNRVVSEITALVNDKGGRFLKMDQATGTWTEIDAVVAFELVSQALRSEPQVQLPDRVRNEHTKEVPRRAAASWISDERDATQNVLTQVPPAASLELAPTTRDPPKRIALASQQMKEIAAVLRHNNIQLQTRDAANVWPPSASTADAPTSSTDAATQDGQNNCKDDDDDDLQLQSRPQLFRFTRILMKILKESNSIMHARAEAVIEDCVKRSRRREPGFENLPTTLRPRLKHVVSKEYWQQAAQELAKEDAE